MQALSRQNSPEFWISQIFSAKAVQKGAVIRRSMAWIDREVGRDRFIGEVRRRGFRLVQTADQFIVICHSGSISIVF
ncbi:hypothetical protein PEL8287_03258 [Roseovarius litorisediminis]|uniref:N-(5'-phosphoribosyl)anthranilate isomerase n=1 Tax=Roseovarius litorisediminis TaxID=1312363 RepID=A0A1Y5TEH1_9RHOB|nr:N-(5'-phosphoribosyl)anthranilate isomerase [Roseovarius litorisediminis]SLN60105.1 hypothetical protein PEL8287_03258 [Roseovarius litorisediminis]